MKLNKTKVRYILLQNRKWVATEEIARDVKVSQRRGPQILKEYKETGQEPIFGEKVRRPRKPFIEKEAEVIRAAHTRFHFGARMLETVILKQFKVCISNNRIHMYLKAESLAQEDVTTPATEVAGMASTLAVPDFTWQTSCHNQL